MDKFDKIINELKKDIKIPDTVMSKYTDKLSSVSENSDTDNTSAYRRMSKKRLIPAIALIAAITGAVTVSAATYSQWSKSIDDHFQPTEEQKANLEDSGTVTFYNQTDTDSSQIDTSNTQSDAASSSNETLTETPDTGEKLSDTVDGITVSVQQSIVDNYVAEISLKIEGYTPIDNYQPDFGGLNILIDGEPVEADMGLGFYHNDGGYIMEDGSLEYNIGMRALTEGYFVDKQMHIDIYNIGHYTEKAQSDIVTDIEGTWSLDFALKGTDTKNTYELNAPLDESGITLLYAELAPLSATFRLDMPREEITETGIDIDGNPVNYTTYKAMPQFMGIILKDGTIQKITGSASQGYVDETSNIYESRISFNSVVDIDQAECLLFQKSIPENPQTLTEDNCYVVPLN